MIIVKELSFIISSGSSKVLFAHVYHYIVQSETLVNAKLLLHYMIVPQIFCKEVRITYVLWILEEWVTIYCKFYTAYFSISPQDYPKIIQKQLLKDREGMKKWRKGHIGSHTLDQKNSINIIIVNNKNNHHICNA